MRPYPFPNPAPPSTMATLPLLSPSPPLRSFRCCCCSSSSSYSRLHSLFPLPPSLRIPLFLSLNNDRSLKHLSHPFSQFGKSFPAQTYRRFQALPMPARCLPVLAEADAEDEDEDEDEEALRSRRKIPKNTNILVVGSTGYIGKCVVAEMVKRGYNVIAIAREASGIGGKSEKHQIVAQLQGATVCFADVTDLCSLKRALQAQGCPIDVVVCCLASRTGGVKDSWRIDYQATKNSLEAGLSMGASHFTLLSAICVQKPLLEFQKAKLKFEAELQACSNITWSIVRPTAFFKSLGGQVESVKAGFPYIMFGDGELSACKPISEADLASFIADCFHEEDKVNKILPVGGPGKAYTPLQQGELLFKILGKQPKFIKVPIQIMDFAIGVFDFLVRIFPSLEDAAEFGKIGRYYAAESMLVLDPETRKYDAEATPSYGSDTLEEFFMRVVRDGMAGQELGDQAVF